MKVEMRLVLTIVIMVCVVMALLALVVVAPGGQVMAGVGTYGRHGSSF